VGRAHPDLVSRLATGELDPAAGSAFVPGCGLGHDAAALAEAGWRVTAVDFAAGIDVIVRRRLEPLGGRFVTTDALAFDSPEPFDLVFDHTFFCAIDPSRWQEYGSMMRRLLRPGGTLAVIVFPTEKPPETGGPPWGMSADDVRGVLGPDFETVADEPVQNPVPRRGWPERWLALTRLR
jgi:SAM-dependent methyltransferase